MTRQMPSLWTNSAVGFGPIDRGSNPRGLILLSSESLSTKAVGSNEPKNYTHFSKIAFKENAKFLDYLNEQGHCSEHVNHLILYYRKHFLGKTYEAASDLKKYILSSKGHTNLVKAVRAYIKFADENQLIPKETVKLYLEQIKAKRTKVDVYVPSTEELVATYNKIKSHPDLSLLYMVLATSGIRYVEAYDFLTTYKPERLRIIGNFGVYAVADTRHTKTINNIYLPLFVCKRLRHITGTYQSLRVRLRKKGGTVSFKYLRKWHYNFMLYNGIPESVADFIQGRASNSVSANHYLAKGQQAEYWYQQIVDNMITF